MNTNYIQNTVYRYRVYRLVEVLDVIASNSEDVPEAVTQRLFFKLITVDIQFQRDTLSVSKAVTIPFLLHSLNWVLWACSINHFNISTAHCKKSWYDWPVQRVPLWKPYHQVETTCVVIVSSQLTWITVTTVVQMRIKYLWLKKILIN